MELYDYILRLNVILLEENLMAMGNAFTRMEALFHGIVANSIQQALQPHVELMGMKAKMAETYDYILRLNVVLLEEVFVPMGNAFGLMEALFHGIVASSIMARKQVVYLCNQVLYLCNQVLYLCNQVLYLCNQVLYLCNQLRNQFRKQVG